MTPEDMKRNVEIYSDLLDRKEKLEKRLISLSGRDPDQEIIVLQRLKPIERVIEFIDFCVYEEEILTMREGCAVEHKTIGKSHKQIGEILFVTPQAVSLILNKAYEKMTAAYNS